MFDYEIRLLNPDGTPTFVYLTSATGHDGALRELDDLHGLKFDVAEIWQGGDCVLRRRHSDGDVTSAS